MRSRPVFTTLAASLIGSALALGARAQEITLGGASSAVTRNAAVNLPPGTRRAMTT